MVIKKRRQVTKNKFSNWTSQIVGGGHTEYERKANVKWSAAYRENVNKMEASWGHALQVVTGTLIRDVSLYAIKFFTTRSCRL